MANKKSPHKPSPQTPTSSLSPKLRRALEQIAFPPLPNILLLTERTIPKSGLTLGKFIHLPKKVQSRLVEKWLHKLSPGDLEMYAQVIGASFMFLYVIGETISPGTPIGDLFSIVSQEDISESKRVDACKRFMKGRAPVAPEKWKLYQRMIEEKLREDAPPGRGPEEELRFKVMASLFEAFQDVRDRPFAQAVVNRDELVDLIFTKLNARFMRDCLGPDIVKEVRRQEYETLRRKMKIIPDPDVLPSMGPDVRELEMELAGGLLQKSIEVSPDGGGKTEDAEILSVFQRADFSRSLEAHFATRFQEQESVRYVIDRVQLNQVERDLLEAAMEEEPLEETAERTGRTIEAIYTARSRLFKKIKLSLPHRRK